MPEIAGVSREVPTLPFEGAEEVSESDLVQKFMDLPTGMDEDEEEEQDVADDVEPVSAAPEELTAEAEEGESPHPEPTPEITPEEREKGYLREQDYTKKMQAAAEERKAFEAERAEIRTKYETELAQYAAVLAQVAPQEPTPEQWEALRRSDPAEFAAQKEEWRDFKEDQAATAAKLATAKAEREAEGARQYQAHLQAEQQRLIEAVPEWKDEAKRTEEMNALFAHATKDRGFSEADLASISDHRLVVLLREAKAYRDLMSKGREQIEEKKQTQKVLQPGARAATAPAGARADARKLIERAKRTGGRDDLMAAFMALPTD